MAITAVEMKTNLEEAKRGEPLYTREQLLAKKDVIKGLVKDGCSKKTLRTLLCISYKEIDDLIKDRLG
ncbi:hypothetical protein A6E01_20530 (plasmid) [Vibrio breoganii]|uniref:Uncharacterized protein n=1 Tax=Vibrio breoganii TaxID=553239 RepID=A0AAN1CUC4_9VIBR|nr:hypothetical protein [Vibrio breoganii]ANO35601.1 hypothetical protein A6E01_20530 [Vibrio breoganii]PML15860.1 hypothetical protein BCT84_07610 [Vibrio breoganii]